MNSFIMQYIINRLVIFFSSEKLWENSTGYMHHWNIMNNNNMIKVHQFRLFLTHILQGFIFWALQKQGTTLQDITIRRPGVFVMGWLMPASLLLVIAASQRGGGRPEQQMPSSGPGLPQDRLLLSWAAWSGERQTGDSISLAANKKYTWVLVVLQHIPHPSAPISSQTCSRKKKKKKNLSRKGKKEIDLSKMFNQYERFLPISLNLYVSILYVLMLWAGLVHCTADQHIFNFENYQCPKPSQISATCPNVHNSFTVYP